MEERCEEQKPAPALVALPNFTALAKKQGPAVVNISSSKKVRAEIPFPGSPGGAPDDPLHEFFKRFGFGDVPREFRLQSLGSGFIIDPDGHILTNAHIVEGADEVMVILLDKREFKAKVIGIDPRSDIALLKISAKDIPFVTLGDPAKLEVGEWVVAIGTPFGFTNSVTQGIVSAKGRALPGESLVPFIQTDAAMNPGNSGGPLFNMSGEVVGVNSQIYSRRGGYMGISFTIPIDVAIKVKDELLKHGKVRRGKLGVSIQNVSPELAESFKLPKADGALISGVEKGGPADRAGLQPGDVVLQFDGKALESSADLARAVGDAAPGASARLKVWRNGAEKELVVELGEADSGEAAKPPPPQPEPNRLGLSLREMSRAERRMQETEGAIIVEAVDGSAAAAGIEPGDIILAIDNKPLSSIEQLRSEVAKNGKRVVLLIQRGRHARIFIALRLKAA